MWTTFCGKLLHLSTVRGKSGEVIHNFSAEREWGKSNCRIESIKNNLFAAERLTFVRCAFIIAYVFIVQCSSEFLPPQRQGG